jgi:hypothetical protein
MHGLKERPRMRRVDFRGDTVAQVEYVADCSGLPSFNTITY